MVDRGSVEAEGSLEQKVHHHVHVPAPPFLVMKSLLSPRCFLSREGVGAMHRPLSLAMIHPSGGAGVRRADWRSEVGVASLPHVDVYTLQPLSHFIRCTAL